MEDDEQALVDIVELAKDWNMTADLDASEIDRYDEIINKSGRHEEDREKNIT